ncbi:hypothetical protein K0U27_04650 [archaeon]|nr:hypothetical protein [archaeon]
MKKYYTAIFFLLAVLALSVPTGFAFTSEGNYDDDSRDDDRYDQSYKEERENHREERKEYRESKVCTNDGECVEDEEFREVRENYRQERDEYGSDRQASPENNQQGKNMPRCCKS